MKTVTLLILCLFLSACGGGETTPIIADSYNTTNTTTTAIMSGVPVAAVRDLAGHEDIRTTQDYTHLIADYLQQETKKIAAAMCGIKTEETANNNSNL